MIIYCIIRFKLIRHLKLNTFERKVYNHYTKEVKQKLYNERLKNQRKYKKED